MGPLRAWFDASSRDRTEANSVDPATWIASGRPHDVISNRYRSWLTLLDGFLVKLSQLPACSQPRVAGNGTTSRMDRRSVTSITRRSMPIPIPPAGGRPYSSASMNASS
jgi:hypothetical protein